MNKELIKEIENKIKNREFKCNGLIYYDENRINSFLYNMKIEMIPKETSEGSGTQATASIAVANAGVTTSRTKTFDLQNIEKLSHFFDKSNKFKNLHIEKREIGVFKIVISNKTTKKELITGEQSESNPITKNERVILSYKEDIKGVITELETLEPNRNESLKNAFLNFDDPLATANINEGVYYLI
tara:strand:+ start:20028 stop:20585 length:558 start_codon:yes stop_codon:yes gene_type:complete